MKRSLLSFVSCLLFTGVYAQSGASDSGVFLLHKFAQKIGRDSYHITNNKYSKTYTTDFKFVDRGSPVPFKAELTVNPALDPLEFDIKGQFSRFSKINNKITLSGGQAHIRVGDSVYDKKIKPLTFPVAGYAPIIGQQLLLQYWKKHHEPASIDILPVGSVQIKRDGSDTVTYQAKPMILERYTIGGLIWGNEFVWTAKQGELIGIIMNDAEFDKFEAMRVI